MSIELHLWASDPIECNDDHITSQDFENIEDAELAMKRAEAGDSSRLKDAARREYAWRKAKGAPLWMEIIWNGDPCGENQVLPETEAWKRNQEREARAEQREQAMLAGMGGGCGAYNEAMGFDLDI